MTPEEFKDFVNGRLNSCLEKLYSSKAVEYSRGNDRLHNFKRAAEMSNSSPEAALWGMLVKHLVSIKDMVDDLNEPKLANMPDKAVLVEKFDDAINYLLLLNALFEERSRNRAQAVNTFAEEEV